MVLHHYQSSPSPNSIADFHRRTSPSPISIVFLHRHRFPSPFFTVADLHSRDLHFFHFALPGLTITEPSASPLSEPEEALNLLQKAVKLLEGNLGQYRTIAGAR
ncbi:hypothetical protein P8452_74149 [Trifolium repens]|nr:hypothetical protein P8452_74149 [Trifolium repens]